MIFSLLAGFQAPAQDSAASLNFEEVYQLLKTKVSGLNEAELNRAAVVGLVSELAPRVQLVANGSPANAEDAISKTSVFEDRVGYVRVARITSGLPEELRRVCQDLSTSNRLSGLVLDLRYANGIDYAASVATADLFSTKKQAVLKWGNETGSTAAKTNGIQFPLAVLVNRSTTGAAEALAGALRYSGAGLVLGSRTAGQALMMEEFSISGGAKLRIATTPVYLGDGTQIGTNGIRPDIEVVVGEDEERSYYADAFYLLPRTNLTAGTAGGTNGTRRARFGEAELVREHRNSLNRDESEQPRVREPEPEKPLVSDPVLARAIDLLKGLAVVRQFRS